jgi:mannose-6-phosphate isomerase-like protein (cupin superfamily)
VRPCDEALPPPQRVVTGHAATGRSTVWQQGVPANVMRLPQIPGTVFYEIWNTASVPVLVDNGPDPTTGPLRLQPPKGGSRVRIVDVPPDTEDFLTQGGERIREAFRQIGGAAASTAAANSPHPLMHRTLSLDYGFVLQGEITLILDEGECVLKAGDVVVQRATNHAWANRSGSICRMAFVLLDGELDTDIAESLPKAAVQQV